jgi:site-specific DNA-methyltransferase (adenine-specific)
MIYNQDCLEAMKEIPDYSIDAIITDPPYGTTACKWDSVIPFDSMWEQLNRIIKPNGAIVLTSIQPFTTILINSNIKGFKYCWYWDKENAGGFATAKYKPLSIIEEVCVFSKKGKKVNYYPIMEIAEEKNKRSRNKTYKRQHYNSQGMASGNFKASKKHNENLRYPKNKLKYNNRAGELNALNRLHPTQKPVALMEYLIKTYTNENETVLDFTMGSGTTGVACLNTNRKFIGIENNKEYFEIALKRIEQHKAQLRLF